ncbi:22617_t:CDS:2 [Cetraspora pellucida]|uniref:22617_t:CDS:1 n=1 Tax=Cetraspora pellucida TaxID=1433469 RepID=A0A9N9B1R7_9GLOM|nr:22617_t:CDS:2 [Cetraspora pellucida]
MKIRIVVHQFVLKQVILQLKNSSKTALHDIHSSVLIDSKLYFSGGYINNGNNVTNEFFYLDVSKPFKTTEDILIPWVDLTYTGGPQKAYVTACIGGKNNDMIFIFGNKPNNNQSFVNQFDTNKQQWINITSSGSVPTDRDEISCAKFNNGLIAIFSGYNYTPIAITNELWIFNTLTSTWNLSNAINAPSSRRGYCAITLPDDNILYIGGVNLTASMPMDNLPLYNTKTNTWTIMNTYGPIPPSRRHFSAVLTPDGRIIIFGGSQSFTYGDLWILDIITYQWSVGNILNPIANLSLTRHTATLVDNYMLVAFEKVRLRTVPDRVLKNYVTIEVVKLQPFTLQPSTVM